MKCMLRYAELNVRRVKWLLARVKASNVRYDVAQFQKFYKDPTAIWLCQYSNGKPSALCVLKENMPTQGCWYVNEIQAFESGHEYGKKMLRMLMKKHKSLWLVQNVRSDVGLNKFYKSVGGLKETKFKLKKLRCTCHLFSQGCDVKQLMAVFS